jgi:hypothetical protein
MCGVAGILAYGEPSRVDPYPRSHDAPEGRMGLVRGIRATGELRIIGGPSLICLRMAPSRFVSSALRGPLLLIVAFFDLILTCIPSCILERRVSRKSHSCDPCHCQRVQRSTADWQVI